MVINIKDKTTEQQVEELGQELKEDLTKIQPVSVEDVPNTKEQKEQDRKTICSLTAAPNQVRTSELKQNIQNLLQQGGRAVYNEQQTLIPLFVDIFDIETIRGKNRPLQLLIDEDPFVEDNKNLDKVNQAQTCYNFCDENVNVLENEFMVMSCFSDGSQGLINYQTKGAVVREIQIADNLSFGIDTSLVHIPIISCRNHPTFTSVHHDAITRWNSGVLDMRFGIEALGGGAELMRMLGGRLWYPLTDIYIVWDKTMHNYDNASLKINPGMRGILRPSLMTPKDITNLVQAMNLMAWTSDRSAPLTISFLDSVLSKKCQFSRLYWRLWTLYYSATAYYDKHKRPFTINMTNSGLRVRTVNDQHLFVAMDKSLNKGVEPFYIGAFPRRALESTNSLEVLLVALSDCFECEHIFGLTRCWPELGPLNIFIQDQNKTYNVPISVDIHPSAVFYALLYLSDMLNQVQFMMEIGRTVACFLMRPKNDFAWFGSRGIIVRLPLFACRQTALFDLSLSYAGTKLDTYRPPAIYKAAWIGTIRYMQMMLCIRTIFIEQGWIAQVHLGDEDTADTMPLGTEFTLDSEDWDNNWLYLGGEENNGIRVNIMAHVISMRLGFGGIFNIITSSIRPYNWKITMLIKERSIEWAEILGFSNMTHNKTMFGSIFKGLGLECFYSQMCIMDNKECSAKKDKINVMYGNLLRHCGGALLKLMTRHSTCEFAFFGRVPLSAVGIPKDGLFVDMKHNDDAWMVWQPFQCDARMTNMYYHERNVFNNMLFTRVKVHQSTYLGNTPTGITLEGQRVHYLTTKALERATKICQPQQTIRIYWKAAPNSFAPEYKLTPVEQTTVTMLFDYGPRRLSVSFFSATMNDRLGTGHQSGPDYKSNWNDWANFDEYSLEIIDKEGGPMYPIKDNKSQLGGCLLPRPLRKPKPNPHGIDELVRTLAKVRRFISTFRQQSDQDDHATNNNTRDADIPISTKTVEYSQQPTSHENSKPTTDHDGISTSSFLQGSKILGVYNEIKEATIRGFSGLCNTDNVVAIESLHEFINVPRFIDLVGKNPEEIRAEMFHELTTEYLSESETAVQKRILALYDRRVRDEPVLPTDLAAVVGHYEELVEMLEKDKSAYRIWLTSPLWLRVKRLISALQLYPQRASQIVYNEFEELCVSLVCENLIGFFKHIKDWRKRCTYVNEYRKLLGELNHFARNEIQRSALVSTMESLFDLMLYLCDCPVLDEVEWSKFHLSARPAPNTLRNLIYGYGRPSCTNNRLDAVGGCYRIPIYSPGFWKSGRWNTIKDKDEMFVVMVVDGSEEILVDNGIMTVEEVEQKKLKLKRRIEELRRKFEEPESSSDYCRPTKRDDSDDNPDPPPDGSNIGPSGYSGRYAEFYTIPSASSGNGNSGDHGNGSDSNDNKNNKHNEHNGNKQDGEDAIGNSESVHYHDMQPINLEKHEGKPSRIHLGIEKHSVLIGDVECPYIEDSRCVSNFVMPIDHLKNISEVVDVELDKKFSTRTYTLADIPKIVIDKDDYANNPLDDNVIKEQISIIQDQLHRLEQMCLVSDENNNNDSGNIKKGFQKLRAQLSSISASRSHLVGTRSLKTKDTVITDVKKASVAQSVNTSAESTRDSCPNNSSTNMHQKCVDQRFKTSGLHNRCSKNTPTSTLADMKSLGSNVKQKKSDGKVNSHFSFGQKKLGSQTMTSALSSVSTTDTESEDSFHCQRTKTWCTIGQRRHNHSLDRYNLSDTKRQIVLHIDQIREAFGHGTLMKRRRYPLPIQKISNIACLGRKLHSYTEDLTAVLHCNQSVHYTMPKKRVVFNYWLEHVQQQYLPKRAGKCGYTNSHVVIL